MLEPRLLLTGAAEGLFELLLSDRPPTDAGSGPDLPPDVLGLAFESTTASTDFETPILTFELRRVAGQPVPEALAPLAVGIRPGPKALLAWEGFITETGGDNNSPEIAQVLPFVKLNRVLGHLSGDDPVDMFRIMIAPETKNVAILLKPVMSTESPRGRLFVFDAEGHLLHNGSLPLDGEELTVNIPPPKGTSPSSLVVGVLDDAPPGDPSDATTGSHYELHIDQELWTEPPAEPPDGVTPPPDPPPEEPGPPPPPTTPTFMPPETQGSTPPPPVPIAGEIDGGAFLVGPPPVRSAGPLGGILTDSSMLTSEGAVDAALAEFPWDADPTLVIPADLEIGAGGEERVDQEDPASVVLLEGPGGFPVLAAASLAGQRTMTDAAAVACLPELLETVGQASTTAVMASRTTESREDNRPTRRSSIALGLHVAALMAIGLLFPDFITVSGDCEPSRRHRRRRRPDGGSRGR